MEPDSGDLDELIGMLKSIEPALRIGAIRDLVSLCGSAAAPLILPSLDDPDTAVWMAAVEALSTMGDGATVAITAALRHPKVNIREHAAFC